MTAAVPSTFTEAMTRKRQRELAALRSPDIYVVEMRLADGQYRALADLSGGQRVALLLSLLLETDDQGPLVIDQPEDELDNRFLWDTVLPALRRLKGRRQLVVATHNANIVVNGDADQVIVLEATARHGRVALSGAIEDARVRDAVVRTVDGGREAFRLRQAKYGF
ncbi:MAG: AAA family ATPase [Candidatus Latescibacterota bacterium]